MIDHYTDIQQFLGKYDIPVADSTKLLEHDMLEFRSKFIAEELQEFVKAHSDNSLEDAIDALIDMCVVIYGTAQIMGISKEQWDEHWREVHSKNMLKIRATSPDQSKRKSKYDIVKPPGWSSPDHTPIINKYRQL